MRQGPVFERIKIPTHEFSSIAWPFDIFILENEG